MFMNCKVCNSALEIGQNTCPVCGSSISEITNSENGVNNLNIEGQNSTVSSFIEPADVFGFDQPVVETLKEEAVVSNSNEVKDMFDESININEPVIASPLPTNPNMNISAEVIPSEPETLVATPIVDNSKPITSSDILNVSVPNENSVLTPKPILDTEKLESRPINEQTPVLDNLSLTENKILPNAVDNSVEKKVLQENQSLDNLQKNNGKKPNRIILYIIILLLMIGAGIGGYYVFLEFGPRQVAQVNKYEYQIDRRYNASIKNNFLIIDNKTKTWSIEISSTVDFKSLEEFTTKTTSVYQEVKATNKELEKMPMVVIEVRDSGKVFYAIAAEKSAGEFISAQITFKDNKLNDEAIEVFTTIVKSAKKIVQKITTE